MIKMFTALFVSIIYLSGCFMPKAMYEQADADRVTAMGSDVMQAWLAENMPDAELTECKAYNVMPLYDWCSVNFKPPSQCRNNSVV